MSEAVTAAENVAEFFNMKWVDILAALLTPTIACFATYIGYRQWKIGEANLREKLFERRYRIVVLAKEVVFQSQTGDDKGQRLAELELSKVIGEAHYLFSPEVRKRLDELVLSVRRLRRIEFRASGIGRVLSEDQWNAVNEQQAELDQKIQQIFSDIDRLTERYLRIAQ